MNSDLTWIQAVQLQKVQKSWKKHFFFAIFFFSWGKERKGMSIKNKEIACVCSSNMNRSVRTHGKLIEAGYTKVRSYGTGSKCKIPSPNKDVPHIYSFNEPYSFIRKTLVEEFPANIELFVRIIVMLCIWWIILGLVTRNQGFWRCWSLMPMWSIVRKDGRKESINLIL